MNSLSRRFADFSNQSGRRNVLFNGKFDIWQRGINFVNPTNATYQADRWRTVHAGATVFSFTRASSATVGEVPTFAQAGTVFNWAGKFVITTPDASIAAGDFVTIDQALEGLDFVSSIWQKPLVLSFWVKANIAGIYCCYFRNAQQPSIIPDRSLVLEYTVNLPNTWEYKEIRVPAPPFFNGINNGSPTTGPGTWRSDNRRAFDVGFTLAGGSTFQTTPGTWQTGNFIATANQVNGVASVGNFLITGVQLEVGNVATPFEVRGFGEELALCQRYFEASNVQQSYAPNNTLLTNEHFVEFRVTKRDLCTLTASLRLEPPTGSNLAAFSVNNAIPSPPIILAPQQINGFYIEFRSVNGADTSIAGNWTADCEL